MAFNTAYLITSKFGSKDLLKGKKETLSGEEFMQIVELAEQQYYEQVLTDSKVGMA